jgi:small subunit ribosomal protein S2
VPVVSMKDLLEAGVHFGHQTRRWNPKMKPYIFTERNGIYILDLQRTLREIAISYNFARAAATRGGQVLFVGTKKQAQEPMQSEAERSGMPYVNQRWLGGMLTNFVTIRSRVAEMERLEQMEADGSMALLPKKEQIKLRHELGKLQRNLDGVREMRELPSAVFVVDTKREEIAVREARRLNIPIIGLVDTNADPDEVDYVVPGNDDAIRSVALMARVIADAVIEGRAASDTPQVVAGESQTPVVMERGAETGGETTAPQDATASADAVPEAEAPSDAQPAEVLPDEEPQGAAGADVVASVVSAETEAAAEAPEQTTPDAVETEAPTE